LIEYVCGHNDKNLGFFYEKSEVVSLTVDPNQHTGHYDLVAIGTRNSIEDLKYIVQTHLNLYDNYQEKED